MEVQACKCSNHAAQPQEVRYIAACLFFILEFIAWIVHRNPSDIIHLWHMLSKCIMSTNQLSPHDNKDLML